MIYGNVFKLTNYPYFRKPLCRVASWIFFFFWVEHIPKLLWTLLHHLTNYSILFLRDCCSLFDFYFCSARHLHLFSYFPSTVPWSCYLSSKSSVENNNAISNSCEHFLSVTKLMKSNITNNWNFINYYINSHFGNISNPQLSISFYITELQYQIAYISHRYFASLLTLIFSFPPLFGNTTALPGDRTPSIVFSLFSSTARLSTNYCCWEVELDTLILYTPSISNCKQPTQTRCPSPLSSSTYLLVSARAYVSSVSRWWSLIAPDMQRLTTNK